MLHGRIVRPRGQGAVYDGVNPPVVKVDATSISHISNAKVVQVGNFVGVVAPQEYDAIQAAAQLKVEWAPMPKLASSGEMWAQMRAFDKAGQAPAANVVDIGNVDKAISGAAKTVSASYSYPYNGHFPIGPSCAVADVKSNGARVFSNAQNIYGIRTSVANVLGFTVNQVRVSYYEGSSCYGSSPQTDVAESAAIMSQAVNAPVRLQFMRWDEHGWDNYGPAQLTDVRAGIDAAGNITAFEYTALGIPYWTTPPTQQQVTGQAVYQTASALDTTISGSQYNIANWRVVGKSLPLQNNYFKVSFLRAPNAPQSGFAAEQAVDELAFMAGMDPVAFRLQNVATTATDSALRWKNVLVNAAKDANWQAKVASSVKQTGTVRKGRGIAFGFYSNTMSCCVADIEVNVKTGKIVVKHVVVSQNNGITVNLEGVTTQMSGALIQGLSRALYEQATWNKERVTSLDWVSYPILRFKDTPTVTLVNVHPGKYTTVKPGDESQNVMSGNTAAFNNGWALSGSGEPPTTAISSAVANAFFDATGVRIRQAPMNPSTVRQTLKDAGVS
jgi:nicotinate dehydrogenase subunit B